MQPAELGAQCVRERTCILVLGMHRSGSSVLTRLFGALGCAMPANLLEPTPDNAKGYWESRPIMRLNDAALASAGSKWDDLLPFNPDWYSSPAYPQFLDRGREVVRGEFGSSPIIVLKDPRICRMVPFWLSVLEEENFRTVASIALRNPLEVAHSLFRRDGMSLNHGLLLWLGYMLEAEFFSRGIPRLVVSYNQSLNAWRRVAENGKRVFGFSWPRPAAISEFDLSKYLDSKDRHIEFNDDDTLENIKIIKWVRDTYKILLTFSNRPLEEPSARDLGKLDAIRTQVNEAFSAFAHLLLSTEEQQKNILAAEAELERLNGQIQRVESGCVALEQEKQEAISSLSLSQAEALHAKAALADAVARAEFFEASLSTERERTSALEQQVAENSSAKEALEGSLAQAKSALAGEKVRAGEIDAECTRLAQSLARMKALDDEREQSLVELQTEKDRLTSERDALAITANDLTRDCERLTGELASAIDNESRLNHELARRLEAQIVLEKALAEAQAELAALEGLRLDLALERNRLEQRGEELAQAWSTVERLEAQVEEIEASRADLAQALSGEEARAEKLATKLLESEKWVFSLAGERTAAESTIARLKKQVQRQERALASANSDAETQSFRVQQALQARRSSNETDSSRIQEIEQQNRQLANELLGVQQALRLAETQLAQFPDFQRKLEERANEITMMTGMLKQAEEHAQTIEAKLAAVPELQKKLSERADEITMMTGMLKQAEEHAQTIEAKLAAVPELQKKLSDRVGEITLMTGMLKQAEAHAQTIAQRQDWLLAVNAVLMREGRWWRIMPARWARARQAKRLAEHNLFDSALYLEMYPDVAQSGMDPIEHFLRHGLQEGRLCPR
jgi:hypothetical protein